MADIGIEDVEYVARLAQLNLDDDAKKRLAGDLSEILSYMDKLNELDTTDIEPMLHVLDVSNVFRDDVIGESLSQDEALRNAPETDGEFFLVPRILDAE